MKNNKGFTLVELLAVVALIGVLTVVAVSTYRGINESSKKKALEAKITQIKAAAEKWGRENNITSRTTISVNNLVVEGYITADEVQPSGLSYIGNPVTSENMICNTIDLIFTNGVISSTYHNDILNCSLAKQSLVDTNIDIRVVDSDNKTLSGSGSIAKWTNKNIVVIVNSPTYESKATSISYDFEGNTITKNLDGLYQYAGTSFVEEDQVKNYYNVFFIKSELILNTKVVVTYDIPGEGTKSRAYTIRFDKEEATATLKANTDWITTETPVTIQIDDGKGSGPSKFYITPTDNFNDPDRIEKSTDFKGSTVENLKVGRYYVWTEDQAGNRSVNPKMIFDVNNVDHFEPDCKVNFHGTLGDHGWYKKDPVTPGGETITKSGASGVNVGVNMEQNNPVYSAFAAYDTTVEGLGEIRDYNTVKEGELYYCHAKTLAGNYYNTSDRLFLDMTPPTSEIVITGPTEHTKTKRMTVTIQDELSGLNTTNKVKYGFSQSPSVPPAIWYDFEITATAQTNTAVTASTDIGTPVTGTWYVWINVGELKDYAGNISEFTSPPGDNPQYNRYGPYKFDNTPPVCNGNNGKTNWTNDSYTILQYCRDNDGTDDQSGCFTDPFMKIYTNLDNVRSSDLTITDNAGNETVCPHDVYLEHIKPTCELYEPGPDGDNGWYKSASVTITERHWDNGPEELQSDVVVFGTDKSINPTNGRSATTFTSNGASLWAHCYAEDAAGNFDTDEKEIKKDDGSEAIAGGCSIAFGNDNWTNIGPIIYGYRLNTPAISGCHDGMDETGMTWTYGCTAHNRHTVSAQTLTLLGHIVFITNSGVFITCAQGTHNIYYDLLPPTCSFTKTSTGTTSGVSVNVTCSDQSTLSGCTSQDTGAHTGLTTSTSYTVSDNAGNTHTCNVTVTAQRQRRDRSCDTYTYCQSSSCPGTCYACPPSCAEGAGGECHDDRGVACTKMKVNCSCRTSSCGCDDYSNWGSWYNVTSCSSGDYVDCQTLYS